MGRASCREPGNLYQRSKPTKLEGTLQVLLAKEEGFQKAMKLGTASSRPQASPFPGSGASTFCFYTHLRDPEAQKEQGFRSPLVQSPPITGEETEVQKRLCTCPQTNSQLVTS